MSLGNTQLPPPPHLTPAQREDAMSVVHKELTLYADARKLGILSALLAFYQNTVWCSPFHTILDLRSRHFIRIVVWMLHRRHVPWSALSHVLGFVKVDLSPEMSLQERQKAPLGSVPFSLRPNPSTRAIYARTGGLNADMVRAIYEQAAPVVFVELLANTQVTTEFEVVFTNAEDAVKAVSMASPKIFFSAFRSDSIHTYLASDIMELSKKPEPIQTSLAVVSSDKVTPLICDNLPYWTTPEQLFALFKEHGEVVDVKFATNDLNGCHFGCCLVLMATQEQTTAAEAALDGKKVNGSTMVVGVLGRDGIIRSTKGTTPKSMGGDTNVGLSRNFNIPMSTLMSAPRP